MTTRDDNGNGGDKLGRVIVNSPRLAAPRLASLAASLMEPPESCESYESGGTER